MIAHRRNSPKVGMQPHSDTLFRLLAIKSSFFHPKYHVLDGEASNDNKHTLNDNFRCFIFINEFLMYVCPLTFFIWSNKPGIRRLITIFYFLIKYKLAAPNSILISIYTFKTNFIHQYLRWLIQKKNKNKRTTNEMPLNFDNTTSLVITTMMR